MTTKRSVIQIDVDDGPFKRFAESFAKYRRALGEAKEQSKELSDATKAATALEAKALEARKKAFETQSKDDKAAAKSAREAASIANANVAALKKKADEERKAATDRKKERDQEIGGLKESARWTAEIARNIASGALSASKWLAFGAIASGFGLGGLASSAATARRQAQGYGINTGDLRAANVNFGKYINSESAFSNIAGTKDSNDRWIYGRVGVDTTGKSAADILPEYLEKVVQAFKATGNNTSTAASTGLTSVISQDELLALASLKPQELADTIKSFQQDRVTFANSDDTNKGWQDFLVSLQRAGQQIETSLIDNLKTLTPYLTDLSEGIVKAINSFVSSGGLQEWIKIVGEGLKKLGSYLGSKEFQEDIEKFFVGMHKMAELVGKFFGETEGEKNIRISAAAAKSVQGYAEDDDRDADEALARYRKTAGAYTIGLKNNNPGNIRIPGSKTGFQTFASENDGLRAIIRQIGIYEDRDKLTTLRGIISAYSPSNENNTPALIANAAKRTGLGADQQIDPRNIDQLVKIVLAITKQEHAESKYTPEQIRVLIQNTTGGNAQASVAGMAAN
jgi:hypothetical protein